jgi:hypothetical protein
MIGTERNSPAGTGERSGATPRTRRSGITVLEEPQRVPPGPGMASSVVQVLPT